MFAARRNIVTHPITAATACRFPREEPRTFLKSHLEDENCAGLQEASATLTGPLVQRQLQLLSPLLRDLKPRQEVSGVVEPGVQSPISTFKNLACARFSHPKRVTLATSCPPCSCLWCATANRENGSYCTQLGRCCAVETPRILKWATRNLSMTR